MPTSSSSPALERFLAARDFLQANREDYDTAYRDFRWPTFSEFNWALDYFDVMARDNDAPALWIVEEDGREARLSFAEMARRSNQAANWLRSLGVARGDRVLLMLGNEVPLWEVMLASIKLGAVIIPATTLLTPEDLEDRITRGQVRHLVIGHEHLEKFAGRKDTLTRIAVGGAAEGWHDFAKSHDASDDFTPDGPTPADDPMLLYFTSGTTSQPKLVTHTHQSYPVGHLSTLYWIGLQKGDRHLNISSPGWAKHAWSCFFAPWNAGACVFLYNYSRFDAAALLKVLTDYEITTLCAPPTVWRLLIQQDLASHRVALREAVAAGEPLNPEVIEQVRRAWGITIRDGFGQTETTAQIGNSPGQPLKAGSMGRPLPGYRVAMLDAEGKPAAEGEVALALGEERPAGLMVGYANDPERTAAAMQGGYYRTGDVASVDEQGYITYVGRADDVFKASDYRISPFELESVLIEHPAVGEAAIVPSPDPVRSSVPKAYVIPAAGYEPSAELARDILAFARERLAPYKRIRRLEFADLPKTISGKIRRVELRQAEVHKASDERGELEFREEDFPDLKE
ncbi:AMP-binding protein [Halomonas alimentaria]|uniref:AMP-binding protein n=1 Tax=Halomonas alimentaria TaxID=147248 RepID=A0A7X4W478_9GAMM|nr:AMP-binding protein [Halomonas alimentaria]NAW34092.1 AMP-binding protein [Halomonas alimentaria]